MVVDDAAVLERVARWVWRGAELVRTPEDAVWLAGIQRKLEKADESGEPRSTPATEITKGDIWRLLGIATSSDLDAMNMRTAVDFLTQTSAEQRTEISALQRERDEWHRLYAEIQDGWRLFSANHKATR